MIQLYGNVTWLCNRGVKKIKYTQLDEENQKGHDHDPSLIIGKHNEYGYDDDPYSMNSNNLNSPSKSTSHSNDGGYTSFSVDEHDNNELSVSNRVKKSANNGKIISTPLSGDTMVQEGVFRENYIHYRDEYKKKFASSEAMKFHEKQKEISKLHEQKKRATQFGEFTDGQFTNINKNNKLSNDQMENINNEIIQLKTINIDDFDEKNINDIGIGGSSSVTVVAGGGPAVVSGSVNVGINSGVSNTVPNVQVTRRGHTAGMNQTKHRGAPVKIISPSLLGDGI